MISVHQPTDVRDEPVTVVVTLRASAGAAYVWLAGICDLGHEDAHCSWTWDRGDALAPGVKHENMTNIAEASLAVIEKCAKLMDDPDLQAIVESGRAAVAVNR